MKKEEAFSKEGLEFGANSGADGFGINDPFGGGGGGGHGGSNKPSLDLAFKEGQTIRVNLNIERNTKKERPAGRGGLALGAGPLLLPPPPGAGVTPSAPSAPSSVISPVSAAAPSNDLFDLLGGLEERPGSSGSGAPSSLAVDNSDPWGDFTSAPSTTTVKSGSWEQF